jgi:hypothetical protein
VEAPSLCSVLAQVVSGNVLDAAGVSKAPVGAAHEPCPAHDRHVTSETGLAAITIVREIPGTARLGAWQDFGLRLLVPGDAE